MAPGAGITGRLITVVAGIGGTRDAGLGAPAVCRELGAGPHWAMRAVGSSISNAACVIIRGQHFLIVRKVVYRENKSPGFVIPLQKL